MKNAEIKKAVYSAYQKKGVIGACAVANKHNLKYEHCHMCEAETPVIDHECLICGQSTAKQVSHTTGELKAGGHGEIHDKDGLLVARVPFGQAKRVFAEENGKEYLKNEFVRTEKEANDYIKRIVKCVNMHDELIDALKMTLEFQDMIRGMSISDRPNKFRHALREKLDAMLKQAEQE